MTRRQPTDASEQRGTNNASGTERPSRRRFLQASAGLGVPTAGAGLLGDLARPARPRALSVVDTTRSSVSVGWSAGTDGGDRVDRYVVTVDGVDEAIVPAGITEATVTGLTPDADYRVGVRAVDEDWNGSPEMTTTVSTATDGTVRQSA